MFTNWQTMESFSVTGNDTTIDLDGEVPSPEQPNSEQPKPKRAKKAKTSDVWNSFTSIGIVDGKEKYKCKGCGKEYVVCGSKYGTSTLNRHIPKCVALPKYHNIGVMMLDEQGKLKSRQVDHKRIREIISMAVIEHNLPYSFVEYKWIRELHKSLNPDAKTYTRNTAMSDVWKFYIEKKEELKQELAKIPSRICLTSDCWTSINVEGFI